MTAVGRFLCLIFEEYHKGKTGHDVTVDDFKALINRESNDSITDAKYSDILSKPSNTTPIIFTKN